MLPLLVWNLIHQYLNYNDRCNLRAVCKQLAKIPNKMPLKYWLERNDPVVFQFKDVNLKKIQNGVHIGPNQVINYEYLKFIYKSGHIDTFVQNRSKILMMQPPRVHCAYFNKRTDILEYILKIPLGGYDYTKYLMASGNFSYTKGTLGNHLYTLLIRYNGPAALINYCGKWLSEYQIKMAQLKNLNLMRAENIREILEYFTSRQKELYCCGFYKACRNNNWELAELILPFLDGRQMLMDFRFGDSRYSDIYGLLNLEKTSILLEFFKKLKHDVLFELIKELVRGGYYWRLKKLILL